VSTAEDRTPEHVIGELRVGGDPRKLYPQARRDFIAARRAAWRDEQITRPLPLALAYLLLEDVELERAVDEWGRFWCEEGLSRRPFPPLQFDEDSSSWRFRWPLDTGLAVFSESYVIRALIAGRLVAFGVDGTGEIVTGTREAITADRWKTYDDAAPRRKLLRPNFDDNTAEDEGGIISEIVVERKAPVARSKAELKAWCEKLHAEILLQGKNPPSRDEMKAAARSEFKSIDQEDLEVIRKFREQAGWSKRGRRRAK
jgi:hypothetical protein